MAWNKDIVRKHFLDEELVVGWLVNQIIQRQKIKTLEWQSLFLKIKVALNTSGMFLHHLSAKVVISWGRATEPWDLPPLLSMEPLGEGWNDSQEDRNNIFTRCVVGLMTVNSLDGMFSSDETYCVIHALLQWCYISLKPHYLLVVGYLGQKTHLWCEVKRLPAQG